MVECEEAKSTKNRHVMNTHVSNNGFRYKGSMGSLPLPPPHPLTSGPLTVQIRRRDENQNVVIERQLYDSCGGRSDADFEYSLGSPPGGGGEGGRQRMWITPIAGRQNWVRVAERTGWLGWRLAEVFEEWQNGNWDSDGR